MCVYNIRIRLVYAHASSASRPTGRTILTSPSLALTNGSAFGELLLLLLTLPNPHPRHPSHAYIHDDVSKICVRMKINT